jgi:hypothetical protein
VNIDESELLVLLQEQVEFMQASCHAYDAGKWSESKRIAVALRVLLHHVGNSNALLQQLGALETLQFGAMGEPVDAAAYHHTGPLVSMFFNGTEHLFISKITPPTRFIGFEEWWTEPVYKSMAVTLTRKSIVLDSANKGGGAHVDPRVNNAYRRITVDNALGWETTSAGPFLPELALLRDPLSASVRTVGNEFLYTLKAAGYFKEE